MRHVNLPNWLVWTDNNLKWLSIPKLPLLLTIIQAVGFLLVMWKPLFKERLILFPDAVFQGEIWRIITFISIPIMDNFLVIILLWFFYDVMIWLEEVLGSTLFTTYFLVSWFSTVFASLMGFRIDTFMYMELSFLFALATLTPNKGIHLFFILPIAFKWMAAFIAVVLLVTPLILDSISHLIYILLLFVTYLIFFGKDYWLRVKKELEKRRRR